MRPVFFKLSLWNDPQKGAKRPAEWGACHGANRKQVHVMRCMQQEVFGKIQRCDRVRGADGRARHKEVASLKLSFPLVTAGRCD